MAKLPKLDHVKYVRSKGKLYAYFNTGRKENGKPVYARLPDPSAVGFYDSYASFKAGRTKRAKAVYTVADLVDEYTRSSDFRDRATATQRLYHIQFAKVVDTLGKFAVDSVEPRHVRTILDNETWGAATQNIFVAVIGTAYTWGRKRGKATAEPTKDIAKAKTGEHDPWPDFVLEAALTSKIDRVRLAAHLLYFTGQRIGDVCALRWGDIRGGKVRLTQQKTKKQVAVPIHSELQAELDRTPRKGLTILTNAHGGAVTVPMIRDELQSFCAGQGAKTVPHGLRKNAVIALLEAGCTIAEVAAITGQTYPVVEHYAAKVNTDRLGDAAMLKFEARRRPEQK